MATTHPTENATGSGSNPIRLRALLAAFLMCVPVVYMVDNAHESTIFSMMVPPISGLLFMVMLNAPLRRFLPRFQFSQADLIVIFGIVSVAAVVAGEWTTLWHGNLYNIPFHAKWSDTYKNIFTKNMPDSMVVKDMASVRDIEGGGKGWVYVLTKIPLFLPKVAVWGGLSMSLCFAMLCINSIMRGAWCERERLSFPLIQLPVSMSEGGGSGGMWKSKAMWIAFVVMFSIDILNGLNYLYPNLPSIPVKTLFQIDTALKDPPLSNIGDFRISIFPFMAAIGFFMPSDLLLSFVVFFLLRKLTHVVLASNGIPQSTFSGTGLLPGAPYFDEQTWGATLALFLGALWVSREYLKDVWKAIRKGSPSEDGGVSHRWAFVGLIISMLVVIWYGGYYGELSAPFMTLYVSLFMILSIVLARVRAQLGPPTHEFAYLGVNSFMYRFFGNKWVTDKQGSFLSMAFMFMNRMVRNHPGTIQLEAMKMASNEKLNQKRLFVSIAVACVVGYFLANWFLQVWVYRTGNIEWTDASAYFENIGKDRHGTDVIGIVMTILGFAIVMVLDLIRFRFPGFPLHPAGYWLSMNYGVDYYWFGLLLALIIKNFVQRYYGLKGYDKLRAVALGILLGEYAAETIWIAMALITKQSTYTISFNDRTLGMQ